MFVTDLTVFTPMIFWVNLNIGVKNLEWLFEISQKIHKRKITAIYPTEIRYEIYLVIRFEMGCHWSYLLYEVEKSYK